MSWTIEEIAQTVGALNDVSAYRTKRVHGFAIDSRRLQEGDLFVPVIGDRDGHDFVDSALDKGAVAAFWSRDLEEAPEGLAIIQVPDTVQALQDFSRHHLKKVGPKLVAITGSNGKTTTKDMTAAVLETTYRTHKTQGNFNNDLGVPLTLLSMPEDTEMAVIEMGMNHRGEIEVLSTLCEPDIAGITMVGESHLEYLGSREGIADAKMEIVSGQKEGDYFIYDDRQTLIEERIADYPGLHVLTFGSPQADLYAEDVVGDLYQTSFRVNLFPERRIQLPIPGVYNINNALFALTVGRLLGVPFEDAANALEHFQLTENRLQWTTGPRGAQLLNDAYNASPTSMKASIRSFLSGDSQGDRWLVLGEMGELGERAAEMHASLKEALQPSKVDHVILYGDLMTTLYQDLKSDPAYASVDLRLYSGDKKEMLAYLKDQLQAEDVALFKSSFGTDLISVVKNLEQS